MMTLKAVRERALRATLCEIEHGVFFATYPGGGPDSDRLANYQIGKSAADAKQRIEDSAAELGYSAVIWREGIVSPLFARPVSAGSVKPAASHAARVGP